MKHVSVSYENPSWERPVGWIDKRGWVDVNHSERFGKDKAEPSEAMAER